MNMYVTSSGDSLESEEDQSVNYLEHIPEAVTEKRILLNIMVQLRFSSCDIIR